MVNDIEFQKYLKMVQSMTLDCQTSGITKETYINNLSMVVKKLQGPAIITSDNVRHVMDFMEERNLLDDFQYWLSGPIPQRNTND